ncbi:hypothetical protein, partial [Pedobacter ureilyticus]
IKLFSFPFVIAFQASPLPPKRSAKVEKNYPPAIQTALFIPKNHITHWTTTRKNDGDLPKWKW